MNVSSNIFDKTLANITSELNDITWSTLRPRFAILLPVFFFSTVHLQVVLGLRLLFPSAAQVMPCLTINCISCLDIVHVCVGSLQLLLPHLQWSPSISFYLLFSSSFSVLFCLLCPYTSCSCLLTPSDCVPRNFLLISLLWPTRLLVSPVINRFSSKIYLKLTDSALSVHTLSITLKSQCTWISSSSSSASP